MNWFDDDNEVVKNHHRDILDHLKHNGVVDKDRHSHKKKRSPVPSQKDNQRFADETLDLHGLTSDSAEQKLRHFLLRCKNRGIRKAIIIHGRGFHSNPNSGPVLKTLVRMLLERDLSHNIRSFRSAEPREGGEGATVVFFR